MKLLILILVLAISVQPLQAGFCDMDMEKNQEPSHHMGQMDQMDQSDQDSHDCCDSDNSDSQEGCDGDMQCGFCFANVSAFPSMIKVNVSWVHQYSLDFSSEFILPSHSSPPFRPPIS